MTTATATTDLTNIPALIDANIGTWQILLDGQPYGPTWTWKDVAADHVATCRRLFAGAWELTDARTGERIACDETEAAFLASQDEFEAREAAEEGAPAQETPAPCIVCGNEIGNADRLADFEWLETDRPACLSCLQDAEAAWEAHYHAINS